MLADRSIGLGLLCLGIAVAYGALNFYVPYQYEPLGPAFFPFILAGALAFAGSVLLLRGRELALGFGRAQLWAAGALVGYAAVYGLFGFLISTAIVVSLVGWLCGLSWWRIAGLTIMMTSMSYAALVLGLNLPLPDGPYVLDVELIESTLLRLKG